MKKFKVTVNGEVFEVEVEEISPSKSQIVSLQPVLQQPSITELPQNVFHSKRTPGSLKRGIVTSPMPGNINRIKVNVGDQVKKGDILLILEAMKMENEINATDDGTVKEILVKKGQKVSGGDILVIIE
ncbi:MAG: Biotin/lipoyl attachment domain-containing protein [Desulfotomaculum sp. 46_296]|nr:MAG: Biotin/lipoyl attachment domain-containing protein [Desulfotomaculum sp. 46_296]HAU31572.1 acetyl-CoA carboxylase biotin carboxyl carrier protein subunit [Desulfotomaculum sp.]